MQRCSSILKRMHLFKESTKLSAFYTFFVTGTHAQLYYAVLSDNVNKDEDQTGLLVKTVTGRLV